MPNTITSFFTFQKSTPAIGQHMDDNFANFRGTRLPMAENTVSALSLTYGIGTSEHRWLSVGIKEPNIVNTVTGSLVSESTTLSIFVKDYNRSGTAASNGYQWTYNGTTGSYALPLNGGFTSVPGLYCYFKASAGSGPIEVQVCATVKSTLLPAGQLNLLVDGSGTGNQVVRPNFRDGQYNWSASGTGYRAVPLSFTYFVDRVELGAFYDTSVAYSWAISTVMGTPVTVENYFMRIREVW